MVLNELRDYIASLLEAGRFRDYCPNGLQVEGRAEVRKIASGVTASQRLLRAATDWGADAVLAGHDHTYERLEEDGIPYFVNGVGGAGRYYFVNILDGSLVRYNADYGAMRVEATETQILFEFINRAGELVDSYEINK